MNATLQSIPSIGPKLALMLNNIGIHSVNDLKSRNPENMYASLIKYEGKPVDRCVLYCFRCAVYYATHTEHDPNLLKWWAWKDKD